MYVCTIYMCMYIVSYIHVYVYNELPRWLSDKESTCQAGDKGSLPRNEGSILAWDIPWTEEPGRLQSMGLQKVGHSLATKQQQQTCIIYVYG